MWSAPEQKLFNIPASQAKYQHYIALVAQPGCTYRITVGMEAGSASGIEMQLYNSEKRTGSHRKQVGKGESIEFEFAVPIDSEELKLCIYPEGIGKTTGFDATVKVEIQTARIKNSYPKLTFGIDTGIGLTKAKELVESIARQGVEDFEVLIHRNVAHADSQLFDDFFSDNADSRIRIIDSPSQNSWGDAVVKEARQEYLVLIDNTIDAYPMQVVSQLGTQPISSDLILFAEPSDDALAGTVVSGDGVYTVANRLEFYRSLQSEKARPVLMRKSFLEKWLPDVSASIPSAYALGVCAAAVAETISLVPVQSWSAGSSRTLPDADLTADELAWLNRQLDTLSSSQKVSLLLGELKRYATRFASVLGENIDAKAQSRFLELAGSYTSLLRATTTSQESFIKACKTTTRMIKSNFENTLEMWVRENLEKSDKVFVLYGIEGMELEKSFEGECTVPARDKSDNYEVVPTDFLPGEASRVTISLRSGSSDSFGFRLYDFLTGEVRAEVPLISSGEVTVTVAIGAFASSPELLIYPHDVYRSTNHEVTVSVTVEKWLNK